MTFTQAGPVLSDTFTSDRVLRAWLADALPADTLAAITPDLAAIGAHAAAAWTASRSRPAAEPVHVPWDAWGRRIDHIELTPTWREGPALAARFGLVAAGHETTHGAFARCDQFARVYLHHVASAFHTCPLAMSDGAATALKASGNRTLIERAVPRLASRDPDTLWLSGQWMTETAGGSDVSRTGTVARRDADGRWHLHGRKWFTSAVAGDMALTLARPDDADTLALFYLETRHADGAWNGIRIDRLKDKLGTRELPTAEIHLDGVPAQPVGDLDHGVRLIAPMLNVTRTWNAVCALATMRRCLALAIDYASRREAFGKPLVAHPLHAATLADQQAAFEAAFGLVFHVAHLLGRSDAGLADAGERAVLRVLTPLAKLWTGKLAVRIASETCEAFGGAGYIEDTGIPLMLRDAQVYPIWEGTTNVLALDTLRAIAGTGFTPLAHALDALLGEAGVDAAHAQAIRSSLHAACAWLEAAHHDDGTRQAGARGFALTLARTFAAALLARHAARVARLGERRPTLALVRFLAAGLDRLPRGDTGRDARALLDAAPFAPSSSTP